MKTADQISRAFATRQVAALVIDKVICLGDIAYTKQKIRWIRYESILTRLEAAQAKLNELKKDCELS